MLRCVGILILLVASVTNGQDLRADAAAGLKKAVTFFHEQVAIEGGYVYRYSADLSRREGEGVTGLTTIWVQPPGTPAVGMAILQAYQRTGEPYYLDVAKHAGTALVRGQLHSGGWNAGIDFDPAERRKQAYRVDGKPATRARNISSFDDDKSQSCFRFLAELDKATGFKEQQLHEATTFGLSAVLAAQHPNGGWSQVWDGPVPQTPVAALKASLPKEWSRKYPGGDYWWHYTFNDGAMCDTVEMLLDAAKAYDEPKYRAAALGGGEFILRAQLPEPQPAWAQQYDRQMHPAWARKFEPPAIVSSETIKVIRTLLRLHADTADKKWLAPIPPAIAWLKRSTLPDGQLARFYELGTNRPLYFNRQYELTYDDTDLPTHYGFKLTGKIDKLEQAYEQAKAGKKSTPKRPSDAEVRKVLAAMNARGAWVERGELKHNKWQGEIIDSATFIRNVETLSAYLEK